MAVLIELTQQRRFPLNQPTNLAGRNDQATVYLDDPTCSRSHFQIRQTEAGYLLEPLASQNPTWVDGQPLKEPRYLRPGAIVQAGTLRFRFEMAVEPAVTGLSMNTIVGDAETPGSLRLEEKIDLRPGEWTIGRTRGTAIPLEHPQVSKLHAILIVSENQTSIRDRGSSNGTFVNGLRLQPGRDTKLHSGDHLDIGPYGFTYFPGKLLPRARVNNIELVGSAITRTVRNAQTGEPLKLLDDVSVVIRPREFVCLLGPSGSGKTTLMGVLSGRVQPEQGVVLVNGQNLHLHFEALKKDIAYVPQKDAMHEKLTVGSALTFTGLLRLPPDLSAEERRAGIDAILDTVALSHRRATPIAQLSGGQLKRASLANEILSQPSLLFLDEVTSGLDEQTDRDMMALFRRVADAGKTVVCITHSLAHVDQFCDLVVILTPGGKVAFIGPPEEALTYFGVARLGELYAKLAERHPDDWVKQFRGSSQYQTYVVNRLKPAATQAIPSPKPGQQLAAQAKTTLRQSLILTLRYLRIWWSSPGALLSMFGQTLLVALLLILVFGNVGEIADPLTKVNRTENLLFLLCVSAFWFGCNNAAKELVKERTIFLRERNYNLVTGSYLSSKVFVLAGIGILQVLVLYGCVRAWCDPPGELFPQALMMIALSLAGTGLGLAISALAGSEEVAIALIPVAVIPQIILSGAIAPLTGMPHDCARGLVTVYWGKRGLDDLLPDPLRGMAREMNLAVEGNYWWAVAVILSHAATFLMIAQLTLYFRGRARK